MKSIITLDGPSGVGKSTIAKLFAKRINYNYLDTGSIYRAITHYIIKEKIPLKDKPKIQEALRQVNIDLRDEKVFLNGEDITQDIRTKPINENVPLYAQNEDIRSFTNKMQLRIAEQQNCIVDGRDIGTVIFPKAFCKFYLDASPKVRTERRYKDMQSIDPKTLLSDVEAELKQRDYQDINRKKSPLRIPLDALIIDTSDKSIEEVIEIMSEHYNKQVGDDPKKVSKSDFEEFRDAMDHIGDTRVEQADIQRATIISIGDDIVLDIGEKKDAIIPVDEASKLDKSSLKVGDEVSVLVKSNQPSDAQIWVSLLAIKMREGYDHIQKAHEEGKPVKGLVTEEVRGGILVDVKGIQSFCPYSELDLYRVNKKNLIGKVEEFAVLSFEKGKIVLSRKKILEKVYNEMKQTYFRSTKIGDVREATVIKIMDYGILVKLQEGVIAFMKNKNVSWQRFEDVNDLVSLGDKIEVRIIDVSEDMSRIEVSKKDAEPDPIIEFARKHKVGDVVEGEVKSIMPYGAFVNVAFGVEGLLHISDMSWNKKIKSVRELLQKGDRVKVILLTLGLDNRKLSLGLKQLQADPWVSIEDKFPLDSMVKVSTTAITQKGFYCETTDGFEGFLHRDDLSWKNETINFKKEFPVGKEMEVKVVGYDKEKKLLRLGLKQKTQNPWKDLAANYGVGGAITGEVTKLIDTGAIVKLSDELEGFCHLSQLDEKQPSKVEDVLKVGDKKEFAIQKIDEVKKQIHLSIRELLRKKDEEDIKKYMQSEKKDKVTIRELMKD